MKRDNGSNMEEGKHRESIIESQTEHNITHLRANRSALSKQVITRLQGNNKAY